MIPLDGWHEFYVLLGTAAAALVALLFVAASIGASVLTPGGGATRTFMSPVLFHYTAVLFLSLIALIPTHTLTSLGITIAIVAAIGFCYSIMIFVRVMRADHADVADRFAYGASPLAAYAATLAAAGLLLAQSPASANVLAGALLLLLVINIRNAWDLMLALARRATEQSRKPGGAEEIIRPPSP